MCIRDRDCGDSYVSDYTEVLPHNYEKQVIEPTCTSQGYTIYTCPDCGAEYIGDEKESIAHTYTSTVTEPTCTEMGFATNVCNDCGYTYISDYTDPLGHDYIEEVTAPTCTAVSYTHLYQKSKNAKKYRKGIEYGSASWGTHKDIEPFMNPVFQKNIPLTQTEWLTMESRVSPPKNARNKNCLLYTSLLSTSKSSLIAFCVSHTLPSCTLTSMPSSPESLVNTKKSTVLFLICVFFSAISYRLSVVNLLKILYQSLL